MADEKQEEQSPGQPETEQQTPTKQQRKSSSSAGQRSAWLAKLWRVWKWELHWQILLGLVLGGAVGLLLGLYAVAVAEPDESARQIATGNPLFQLASLLGDMFLNGLKLIVIPLVTSSIILAIASIGGRAGFASMGLRTLAYYLCTSLIAILVGLGLVNTLQPGASPSGKPLLTTEETAGLQEKMAEETQKLESAKETQEGSSLLDVFRRMVPDNPFRAGVEGNLLGLIIISLLTGFFLSQLDDRLKSHMVAVFEGIYEITIGITNFVLHLAPIGVAMLLLTTVAENYAQLAREDRFGDFVASLLWFALTAFLALATHLFLVMPTILLLVARVNPLKHYQAMLPAMLTAFSTSSSNATLPVTMESVERRAGVSRKTTSFVLPLGATVNMDGTALYECVAAIFIVQAFDIPISFSQQFFIVMVALLTSIGVAGVPSASLVAIIIILSSLTRQLHAQGYDPSLDLTVGLPLLLVFDRLLDMCRTTVNIFSDSCGAMVVARTQGEANFYPAHPQRLVD